MKLCNEWRKTVNKNKWKGLLTFDSELTFMLCVGLSIITVLTENSFNLTWWKDANIWINDFFVNSTVFIITYTFLSKIKSQSVSFIVSYILSLIIGNFVYLDVSNTKFTWYLVVALVLTVVIQIYVSIVGYQKGHEKGELQANALMRQYASSLCSMPNETRTELYNMKRFIKKHPKECELISRLGVEGIMSLIEDDKAVRKMMKDIE